MIKLDSSTIYNNIYDMMMMIVQYTTTNYNRYIISLANNPNQQRLLQEMLERRAFTIKILEHSLNRNKHSIIPIVNNLVRMGLVKKVAELCYSEGKPTTVYAFVDSEYNIDDVQEEQMMIVGEKPMKIGDIKNNVTVNNITDEIRKASKRNETTIQEIFVTQRRVTGETSNRRLAEAVSKKLRNEGWQVTY